MSEPVVNPVAVDDSIPGPVAGAPAELDPTPAAAPEAAPEPERPARRRGFGRDKRIALAVALSATTLVGAFIVNRVRHVGTETQAEAKAKGGTNAARRAPAVAQIAARTPSATPPRSVAEVPPTPAPVARPKAATKYPGLKVADNPPAPVDPDAAKARVVETPPEPAVVPPAESTESTTTVAELPGPDAKDDPAGKAAATALNPGKTGDDAANDPGKVETVVAAPAPEVVAGPKPEGTTESGPKPEAKADDATTQPTEVAKGEDEPLAPLPTPAAGPAPGKVAEVPQVTPSPTVEDVPAAAPMPKEDPLPPPAEAPTPTAVPATTPQPDPAVAEPRELPAPAVAAPAKVADEPPGDWVALPNRRTASRPASSAAAAPATIPTTAPDRPDEPGDDDDGGPIRHTVARGENFWTLARKYYGSGRFYKALWAANRDLAADPEALEVGMTIRVPMPEALDPSLIDPPKRAAGRTKPARPRPETEDDDAPPVVAVRPTPTAVVEDDRPAPRRRAGLDHPTHRVRAGENLRTIARDYLGDPFRESELADLNPDTVTDPPRVPIGTVLVLPDDAHATRKRAER